MAVFRNCFDLAMKRANLTSLDELDAIAPTRRLPARMTLDDYVGLASQFSFGGHLYSGLPGYATTMGTERAEMIGADFAQSVSPVVVSLRPARATMSPA